MFNYLLIFHDGECVEVVAYSYTKGAEMLAFFDEIGDLIKAYNSGDVKELIISREEV